MIYCQDLTTAAEKTKKRFERNPYSSVSAMFRTLRKDFRLSLIGDYPLLATIVNTISEMGIPVSKSGIQWTIRKESIELKGQKTLLRQLLSHHMVIRKGARLSNNAPDIAEMTIAASKIKKR